MPRKTGRKYDVERVHPEIAGWYAYLASRNRDTAENYLHRLSHGTYDALGISPAKLLTMDQDELQNAAAACITHQLEVRHLQRSSVQLWQEMLASFLKWNGKSFRRIKIRGGRRHLRAQREAIPSREDLARVLAACDPRSRAVLALMAFAGLRPGILGRQDRRDGLRIQDVEGLDVDDGKVLFRDVPTCVKVPEGLSKNGMPFFTHLGQEGCDHVGAYLEGRVRKGEVLKPDSPLISTLTGGPSFCHGAVLTNGVRRAMRAQGLTQVPYVWRSYYAHQCTVAASRGMHSEVVAFFMGHMGGILAEYALHKWLPEPTLEAMRDAYIQALPQLETRTRPSVGPGLDVLARMLFGEEGAGADLETLTNLEVRSLFPGVGP